MNTGRLVRFAGLSLVITALYLVAVGIPTAIIPNPLFIRMLPAGPLNYAFWIVPALLFGPLLATYLVPIAESNCPLQRRATAGGILSFLAVGCPICNKVVVVLLGVGGALNYFQPLQPVLGAASVLMLAYALWLRVRPSPLPPLEAQA